MLSHTLQSDHLAFVTVGDVDYAEGLKVLSEGLDLYAAKKPNPARVLFDIRRSTENRGSDEIRGIVEVVTQRMGPARVVVVASTPLLFGMSRMLTAYLGIRGVEAAVFQEPEDAVRWLLSDETEPSH